MKRVDAPGGIPTAAPALGSDGECLDLPARKPRHGAAGFPAERGTESKDPRPEKVRGFFVSAESLVFVDLVRLYGPVNCSGRDRPAISNLLNINNKIN